MTWKECKILIVSDLKRLQYKKTWWGGVKYLIFNASFRITFYFRIGSYLKAKHNLFFKFLYAIVFLIHKHNQYLTGIQLAFGTHIGPGISFGHFSCIVINSSVVIGKNCTIFQGVTLGSVRGIKGGVPHLGDNVIIFPGAKIIGHVIIGNNVVIGANAVVTHDIPNNSIVAGIPAKVISNNAEDVLKFYI